MHIWVPRIKILENTREELVGPTSRVSGAYKIVGKLDDGRTRIISDWFPNIVTNIGLDRWGINQPIVQCSVGSGLVAPAATDTALGTWVADATTNSSVVYAKRTSGTPYYGYGTATFTFAPPGTTKTISEVGVGWGSAGTNLFSRARIKNSLGADTQVTWLSAETLYVYYEARLYPYELDATYSNVTITGAPSTFSGTTRLMKATDATAGVFWNDAHSLGYPLGPPGTLSIALHTGAIGTTITSSGPAGTRMPCTSGVPNAFVAGNRYTSGSVTWGPNDGVGTIMALSVWPTVHPYQTSISPSIVKAAGWTLTLNIQGPQWIQY